MSKTNDLIKQAEEKYPPGTKFKILGVEGAGFEGTITTGKFKNVGTVITPIITEIGEDGEPIIFNESTALWVHWGGEWATTISKPFTKANTEKTSNYSDIKVADKIEAMVDYPVSGAVLKGEIGIVTAVRTGFDSDSIIVNFPSQENYRIGRGHFESNVVRVRKVDNGNSVSKSSIKPSFSKLKSKSSKGEPTKVKGSIKSDFLKRNTRKFGGFINKPEKDLQDKKEKAVHGKAILIDTSLFVPNNWYYINGVHGLLSEYITKSHLDSGYFPVKCRVDLNNNFISGNTNISVKLEDFKDIEKVKELNMANTLARAFNLERGQFYLLDIAGNTRYYNYLGINSTGAWQFDKESVNGEYYDTLPFGSSSFYFTKLSKPPIKVTHIVRSPKEVRLEELKFLNKSWYRYDAVGSIYYIKPSSYDSNTKILQGEHVRISSHGKSYNTKGDWANPDFLLGCKPVNKNEVGLQSGLPDGHIDKEKPQVDFKVGKWYKVTHNYNYNFYIKVSKVDVEDKFKTIYGLQGTTYNDILCNFNEKGSWTNFEFFQDAVEVTNLDEIQHFLPDGHPDKKIIKTEASMKTNTKGSIKSGFTKKSKTDNKLEGSIKPGFSSKKDKLEKNVWTFEDLPKPIKAMVGEIKSSTGKRKFKVDLPVHSSDGFHINDIVRVTKYPGKNISGFESEWFSPMTEQVGKQLRVMKITDSAIWLDDGYRYPSCALEIVKSAVPKEYSRSKVTKIGIKGKESPLSGSIRTGDLSSSTKTPSPRKEMHGESIYSRSKKVTPIKQLPLKGY